MNESVVKKIYFKEKLIAFLFNSNDISKTEFVSDPNDFFQLGLGCIKDTISLEPHVHNKIDRNINETSEFIYVVNGKMDIEILAQDGTFVSSIEVMAGYGFLQYFGGHKITIHANTQYFELKQGPYLGHAFDKDIV